MTYFADFPQDQFGIQASLSRFNELDHLVPSGPTLHESNRAYLTLNNFGLSDIEANIAEGNWFIKDILDFSKQASLPIFDIGAGYGSLAKKILKLGSKVIINDMEERHLLLARKNIANDYLDKLWLKPGKFPHDIDLPAESIAVVTLIRVMLFLSPAEIEEGLAKIYQWLKPKGKIFIYTFPPQFSGYSDKVMPIYENRWKLGEQWPGYRFNSEDIFKNSSTLPKVVHLMDKRPLERALKAAGFSILKAEFVANNRNNIPGNELLGLIACKD